MCDASARWWNGYERYDRIKGISQDKCAENNLFFAAPVITPIEADFNSLKLIWEVYMKAFMIFGACVAMGVGAIYGQTIGAGPSVGGLTPSFGTTIPGGIGSFPSTVSPLSGSGGIGSQQSTIPSVIAPLPGTGGIGTMPDTGLAPITLIPGIGTVTTVILPLPGLGGTNMIGMVPGTGFATNPITGMGMTTIPGYGIPGSLAVPATPGIVTNIFGY
jgi:hypothetical protein